MGGEGLGRGGGWAGGNGWDGRRAQMSEDTDKAGLSVEYPPDVL
jgi:hypothetical protein